ncbi:MAG: hypothetical protein JJU41_03575 [Bacteroidetes bacterium]|nr:hypothetical protein [Bacteroidota bacterium]MCH8524514.1 hypothetical protein [Balneolales bacterium]
MKRILLIALAVLSGFYITSFLTTQKAYELAEDLREAMQERMSDMLRIHADLEAGKTPVAKPLTSFAGLPHSEHVDDVSEYQDFFMVFESMYADIFTSENPRQQFNIVMSSCIACHQNVCPGPLRSMNRLLLPASF